MCYASQQKAAAQADERKKRKMERIEELIMELEMAIERYDVSCAKYYHAQAKNELARLCKLKDKHSKQLVKENLQKLYNLECYL